jgi:hypothetical protein
MDNSHQNGQNNNPPDKDTNTNSNSPTTAPTPTNTPITNNNSNNIDDKTSKQSKYRLMTDADFDEFVGYFDNPSKDWQEVYNKKDLIVWKREVHRSSTVSFLSF